MLLYALKIDTETAKSMYKECLDEKGYEAKAYNGASIEKYYYKIDNEEYVESTSKTYTFTNLALQCFIFPSLKTR